MKKSKLDNTTIGPSLASTKSGHPHNYHDGVYETPTDACAGRRARPQLNAARGKNRDTRTPPRQEKNDDGLISRRIVTRLLINTPIAKERSSIFHRENIPFSALPPPTLSRIRSESVSLGSLLKKKQARCTYRSPPFDTDRIRSSKQYKFIFETSEASRKACDRRRPARRYTKSFRERRRKFRISARRRRSTKLRTVYGYLYESSLESSGLCNQHVYRLVGLPPCHAPGRRPSFTA